MKKLVLAALAVVLIPTLVSAQGTLSFGTANPATQYFLFEDGTTRAPAGTLASLWWSPDNVVAYTLIGNNTVTVNGWITAATIATTGSATPAGSSGWFYVAGATTDGLRIGQTPNFQNGTGNPNGVPTPTPPSSLTGWAGPITLAPVPEPSMFALAGLGAAALLIFRRRK